MSGSLIEVTYDRVIQPTDDAICFEIDGREVWIPKSQLQDDDPDEDGGTFEVPEWLAIDRELV